MRHIRVKTANLVAGQSLLSKNLFNKLEKFGLKFVGNHFLHIEILLWSIGYGIPLKTRYCML